MTKEFLKKAIKVIAIIGAYLMSMIGSAIIGAAITLAAQEKVRREKVKTEVKEAKTERSNDRVIIGFARTE